MTVQEIIYKLKTDFQFLVSIVVSNNPDAVRRKLSQTVDGNYENESAMVQAITELYESGHQDIVANILSVPFKTENANENLIKAYNSFVGAGVYDVSTKLAIPDGGFAGVQTIDSGDGGGGGFASWSGGMFNAIGQIGAAWLGNQGSQSGTGGVSAGNFGIYQPQPQQKSNTIWWIVGIVILVLIVVAILLFRRK